MKPAIAVTLIIFGALLIMTPVLADFLHQRNVVAVMANSGAATVMLAGQLSDYYRFGCWLMGSGMICAAVYGSWLNARRAQENASLP
jgi:hypothetical protein